MARAFTMSELINRRYDEIQLPGKLGDLVGCPELSGNWIIWGPSGNGKTSFVLQLLKAFAQSGIKCIYNSLEEGDGKTLQAAAIREGMGEVSDKILALRREPIDDLKLRLQRHKSPRVIVVDSLQYTGISYPQYKALKEEFSNKLFIWVSHADGREPASRTARTIRYDCDVKIRIEGFVAYATSRYGGGKHYVISEEKALELNGKLPE